ncbi:MAG: MBL fold metallo-hydrolase [Clostridiales bacterium]|jgi:glyoxylase-like metal-dependent hydrolase (beta-lactamase superfamily II)|nr:MBL fold metallo-hydrolase [Clostridiales bacterium]
MKPIKISNRNIMFTQPMTDEYDLNLGLILGDRHNFIIDTGLGSGSVAPILDYIGDCTKPIIVINTHSHWDHVWGNWVFDENLIISHQKCHELLDKYWELPLEKYSHYIDGEAHKCLPNQIFEGILGFPDDGIILFHTPGHTDDGISILDTVDKVLYAGDNIGDTDDEIVPKLTDLEAFRGTIAAYKKLDFEICISGHNKPQNKSVLARIEAEGNLD